MKAVIQRVLRGSVTVDGQDIANIGKGFIILLGIEPQDTIKDVENLASKVATLRIFEDGEAKMNLSCLDVAGEAIVVSQFTLLADTSRGRRPSFIGAAKPELAEPLCEYFVKKLIDFGIPTQSGRFGAHMLVSIENDGPVTIILDYPEKG